MTDIAKSKPHSWRAPSLRSAADLVDSGLVSPEKLTHSQRVAEVYAVAITPVMADLIDRDDPGDPIARQFVPSLDELDRRADELTDPIGDNAHMPVPGIVHRYPDRLLLKPIHSCPVYCRFCFRREMVGPGGDAMNDKDLAVAFDYIRSQTGVFEVIITGGDPLMLSARRLEHIVASLSQIPHLGVIRIYTRVPIVDPARIDEALLAALDTDKGLFVAIHANHPREFTAEASAAIRRLTRAGVALVGQSVLLRGVNDEPEILSALFRAMVTRRIKPYYLHHGDLAPGTSHFRTSLAEGRRLVGALRGHLSGLCQPTYVLDLPSGFGKVPAGPPHVAPTDVKGEWDVTDFRGRQHSYKG